MYWYKCMALGAAFYCFIALLIHFVRIIRLGGSKDLSKKSGSVSKGILYSNTIAMMPNNKESAYLHLPTYLAGILFHCGVFLSFLLFILLFFNPVIDFFINYESIAGILIGILSVSTTCGYSLLLKRFFKRELKVLSNPDDYVSNFLTSSFQLFTLLYLFCLDGFGIRTAYYCVCTALFIYIPFGKLKHLLYYFSARYHLGFFYGWRNVWPQKSK